MRSRSIAWFLVVVASAACSDGGGSITGGGGTGGGSTGGGGTGGGSTGGGGAGGVVVVPIVEEPTELAGITAAHNAVREAHGVPPLEWDPVLAGIAQAWADSCVDVEYPPGLIDHNPNRSDGYPTYVGENVFGSGSVPTGQEVVDLWASEEANYDYDTNSCADNAMCGHYTQVVWAETTHVGCALGHCPGLAYEYVVVCDYGPGGNDGRQPY